MKQSIRDNTSKLVKRLSMCTSINTVIIGEHEKENTKMYIQAVSQSNKLGMIERVRPLKREPRFNKFTHTVIVPNFSLPILFLKQ